MLSMLKQLLGLKNISWSPRLIQRSESDQALVGEWELKKPVVCCDEENNKTENKKVTTELNGAPPKKDMAVCKIEDSPFRIHKVRLPLFYVLIMVKHVNALKIMCKVF